MNQAEKFDVIIEGTTLEASICGAILSLSGLNVMQISSKDFYGEHEAALTLNELRNAVSTESLRGRIVVDHAEKCNILLDLSPRIFFAESKIVELLVHSEVTNYLDFQAARRSTVYSEGSVANVPLTVMELVSFSKLSAKAKSQLSKLIQYFKTSIQISDESLELPLSVFLKQNDLSEEVISFIENAILLGNSSTAALMKYYRSVNKYSDSAFIVPSYGYGDLSQAFSRLIAVMGGVQALSARIEENRLFIRNEYACDVVYEHYDKFSDHTYPHTVLVLKEPGFVQIQERSFSYLKEHHTWIWRASNRNYDGSVYATLVLSSGFEDLSILESICDLDSLCFHYVQESGRSHFTDGDDIFDAALSRARKIAEKFEKEVAINKSLQPTKDDALDELIDSLDALL